jgi:hypothetical protein
MLVMLLGLPGSATAQAATPTETAELAVSAIEVWREVLHWQEQVVDAGADLYRVENGSLTYAYRLQLASPDTNAVVAVPYNESHIPGAEPAAWIAQQAPNVSGGLSPISAEHAARQLAIWRFTAPIDLNSQTVPNPQILQRAVTLATAAQQALDRNDHPSREATGFNIAAFDGGGFNEASVGLDLRSNDIQDTISNTQLIDVRRGDAYATICSGETTRVFSTPRPERRDRYQTQVTHPAARKSSLEKPCDGAGGDTKGTAILQVDRPSSPQRWEFVWTVTQDPGVIFVPKQAGSAIVTADEVKLVVREDYVVEPATIADLADRIQHRLIQFVARQSIGCDSAVLAAVRYRGQPGDLARRASNQVPHRPHKYGAARPPSHTARTAKASAKIIKSARPTTTYRTRYR